MMNQSNFFLLPPVRWALGMKHLDTSTINFKPPETLEVGSPMPGHRDALHAKFVWKFGIIMYLLISKAYPFTFVEANGNNSKIDSNSAKKLAQLIRYRISTGLNWNSTFDPINKLLKQCLVCDPNLRISFARLKAEFTTVYGYYKPKEEASKTANMMANFALRMAGNQNVPETRQVLLYNA